MNSADSFSATYAEARARFRAAAAAAGAGLEAVSHPERGRQGEDLATDVAWIGPRDAGRVLVTISGTHGAEGFCGSGAQLDWLARGEAARLPTGVAALMIHAINPYGFSWLRRVTHENVDLNRNWVDFDAPLPANPGYDAIAEAAVPAEWTPEAQARSESALGAYVGAHGPGAFQQAISGGQFRHPGGLFYGGAAPSWSRRTQSAIFAEYLNQAARVGIIDYHTGLGPWGYGERIVTDAMDSPGFARARAWWGAAITSPSGGTSTSARITGDGLEAAPRLVPHAEVTGMAMEIGTRSLAEVLLALRADAWLHAHADPLSPEAEPIKAKVREAFYGDADDWKGMVAGQSLVAVRQAIAGLTA
ncbi:MAG TPA: M14 family metallopeptidase [Caulobacteraceae bacterium]|nr:M14 family metallopeptidase [Caulobacteraceae bacterium]